ncbi:MAG: hypothetical protein IT292_02840 [Deltaproteobacteria bacterium]|nr:hypothetical protein [Deltaproteobacteria bacterium]
MTIELTDNLASTIDTTIGELLAAIREAALECQIKEEDIPALTELVLYDLLAHCA